MPHYVGYGSYHIDRGREEAVVSREAYLNDNLHYVWLGTVVAIEYGG